MHERKRFQECGKRESECVLGTIVFSQAVLQEDHKIMKKALITGVTYQMDHTCQNS